MTFTLDFIIIKSDLLLSSMTFPAGCNFASRRVGVAHDFSQTTQSLFKNIKYS